MASSHYVGKAGHLAAMADFAWRGYNVAMPEIDVGDDVFVYRDATTQTWRIQVKTSKPTNQVNSDRYQFRIKESQINTPANPSLHFVFALRQAIGWRYIVIERGVLHNYRQIGQFGSDSAVKGVNWVNLNITVHHSGPEAGNAFCSGQNITHHLHDFGAWPAL